MYGASSRSPRAARLFSDIDPSLVILGIGRPDTDRQRSRAMSEAPRADHAHGNESMR